MKTNIKKEIKKVLAIEAAAIAAHAKKAGGYECAVKLILSRKNGKVIVAGIGKSGLVGQKISATLSSTGTPSMFLHPVEAVHGDIGIISKNDVVIVISQSGETEELGSFISAVARMRVPIVAITGKKGSMLAKKSTCVIDSSVKEEACPMGLAPTASTSVQLAAGDAIAVALLKMRGFKREDFAKLHPGGSLGKKLTLKVSDLMHVKAAVPQVRQEMELRKALLEMTKKRFGCTAVTGRGGKVAGIFTDGDLRRLMEKHADPFGMKMSAIMTKNPKTISPDSLAVDALAAMEERSITVLLVLDKAGRAEGIIHLHDILRSGVV